MCSENVNEWEKSLLGDANVVDNKDAAENELLLNFINQNYNAVLGHDVGRQLLEARPQGDGDNLTVSKFNLENRIIRNVEAFLSKNGQQIGEAQVLTVAVSCLQLFVQNNWTGPMTAATQFLGASLDVYDIAFREYVLGELSVDGEAIYSLTRSPEYLLVARILLLDCREQLKSLQSRHIWLLRCLSIQQQLLEDKSPTIKATALELMNNIPSLELMTDLTNRDFLIQFHLEAGYLCHLFYEYKRAKQHFAEAKKLSGLSLEMTGALGKRTRFQEHSFAQLILKVTKEESTLHHPSSDIHTRLPKDLSLNDDTVLNKIKLEDDDIAYCPELTQLEQAVILGQMEDHKRRRATDESLLQEELHAYLTCILYQPKNWSIQVTSLFIRSKLEANSRRRVERSLMQVEDLVNQTITEESVKHQRLNLFYCVKTPIRWQMQRELADLMLSLGSVGSGLEIYETLHLWDAAIECYKKMGKTEKAVSLIKEQLAIKETPSLYCYLGEVTNDIRHFEKAWELSNHRSAKAQRCMGYAYLGKEQFEMCLECLEKSLHVNALQVPVWFTYGCAALACRNYEKAVKGFHRCVILDYDNFEAWNNLATAYIRLNKKHKAFLILQDALKCSYENWKVWENYIAVATDCGEFEEAINAYNRLIELKTKYVDEQVLAVLVRAITEDIPDPHGHPASRLHSKALTLFGRITAGVTGNSDIWRLYAELSDHQTEDPAKLENALQYLQKSHRCLIRDAIWHKDIVTCQRVGALSLKLAKSYMRCSDHAANSNLALQMLSSSKLMLKGVVAQITNEHTDSMSQELKQEVRELVDSLKVLLDQTVSRISQVNAS